MTVTNLNELAKRIHTNAEKHGFWVPDRNFGEMIALAHSELSEALEEHRSGNDVVWYGEGGKPEGTAVEIIDCIIRCLDMLDSLDVDIDAITEIKMQYNENRPYKHGREY